MQRRHLIAAGLAAATPIARAQSRAETTWPSRPVSLVVGYAAGGPTDLIARAIAEPMGRRLGQNVIVENRPGASGAVATIHVRNQPADTHQLLFNGSGGLIMAPLLNSKVGFRTSELVPVARVSNYPYFLVVSSASPIKSAAELVQKAREKEGALSYASAGPGSGNHMATEWFQAATKTRLVHAPYSGDSAAMPDVIAGRIDFAFLSGAVVQQQEKAGKLRVLATATTQRERAGGHPTVEEAAGIRGFAMEPWTGIFGPPGMPSENVQKINAAVAEALALPETRAKLDVLGQYAFPETPARFKAFIDEQAALWAGIVRDANIPRA
jgi:tripartite-type tricarboxylate transporter receptor subunit TctC